MINIILLYDMYSFTAKYVCIFCVVKIRYIISFNSSCKLRQPYKSLSQ